METLNRLSKILREEEAWMNKTIRPMFNDAVIISEKNRINLSISNLNTLHTAVQRRILRHAIESVKGDLRRITYAHIEKMITLCEHGPQSGRLDLPDRIRVERDVTTLAISKHEIPLRQLGSPKGSGLVPVFTYQITEPEKRAPQVVWIEELGGHLKLTEISNKKLSDVGDAGQLVAFFDMNKIHFPLIVRNIQPGDRFSPLGMKGTQKIKDFFINNKIPRAERIKCPVMVSDGKIVWVMGHRIDDSVKVTPCSQKLLKAEVLLA
jgi:tRNA(Ile)-lysidine synthase